MTRRPTIIDVALAAGVSKSTGSLVVRGSPTVRDETREAVRKAMADLGYVYNRAAATMRQSNAGLVGLVINDLRNPFFTEFATSLQMALLEKGYSAVVANTDEDPVLQDQVVGTMIEHGVSALLICPAYGDTQRTFDAIDRARIPAMQLLRKVDERLDRFPFVAPDYARGTAEATRHLLERGAKAPAFVGGLEGRAVTEERKAGYLTALDEANISPLVLTGKATRSFGRQTAALLARDHAGVDSALCFNDLVALGLLTGCQEAGRQVGSDFRIVGFDDIEEMAQILPSVSSVSCHIADLGAEAAAITVGWVEDGKTPAPETRTAVDLIVRQSS